MNYSKAFKDCLVLETSYGGSRTVLVDKKGNLSAECSEQIRGEFSNSNNLHFTAVYNKNCAGAGLGAIPIPRNIQGTRK